MTDKIVQELRNIRAELAQEIRDVRSEFVAHTDRISQSLDRTHRQTVGLREFFILSVAIAGVLVVLLTLAVLS